jgi:hypothetical protein
MLEVSQAVRAEIDYRETRAAACSPAQCRRSWRERMSAHAPAVNSSMPHQPEAPGKSFDARS